MDKGESERERKYRKKSREGKELRVIAHEGNRARRVRGVRRARIIERSVVDRVEIWHLLLRVRTTAY